MYWNVPLGKSTTWVIRHPWGQQEITGYTHFDEDYVYCQHCHHRVHNNDDAWRSLHSHVYDEHPAEWDALMESIHGPAEDTNEDDIPTEEFPLSDDPWVLASSWNAMLKSY